MQQNIITTLLCIISMSLGLTNLYAQEAIPVAYGNATGNSGSVSYTVGQVNYSNYMGTNGNVNQGIQQPYDVKEIMGLNDAKGINITITAFPNPVLTFLTLKVENYPLENLNYEIFTLDGKSIESKRIDNNETTIEMNKLSLNSYFLKIRNKNNDLKVFTIIKH